MGISSLFYEWQRRKRIQNPEKHDHSSYLLIGIMGAEWWIEHGFHREYAVGRCNIDLAQPKYKIAIEGDGYEYHGRRQKDIVHDGNRDRYLQGQGWYVLRFWHEELQYRPAKVRKRILETYANFAPASAKDIALTRRQMKRSGF